MAQRTVTIRVNRETRDLLATQARERGTSLAAMLAGFAHEAEREAAFEAERNATRRDLASAAARTEEREWEATLGDGVA